VAIQRQNIRQVFFGGIDNVVTKFCRGRSRWLKSPRQLSAGLIFLGKH